MQLNNVIGNGSINNLIRGIRFSLTVRSHFQHMMVFNKMTEKVQTFFVGSKNGQHVTLKRSFNEVSFFHGVLYSHYSYIHYVAVEVALLRNTHVKIFLYSTTGEVSTEQ